MSYSDKNPAWNHLHQSQHDHRIQEEIRIARALIEQHGMTRDEALREAARICDLQETNRGS